MHTYLVHFHQTEYHVGLELIFDGHLRGEANVEWRFECKKSIGYERFGCARAQQPTLRNRTRPVVVISISVHFSRAICTLLFANLRTNNLLKFILFSMNECALTQSLLLSINNNQSVLDSMCMVFLYTTTTRCSNIHTSADSSSALQFFFLTLVFLAFCFWLLGLMHVRFTRTRASSTSNWLHLSASYMILNNFRRSMAMEYGHDNRTQFIIASRWISVHFIFQWRKRFVSSSITNEFRCRYVE